MVDPKREDRDRTVAFVRLWLCELTAPEVVIKDGNLRHHIESLPALNIHLIYSLYNQKRNHKNGPTSGCVWSQSAFSRIALWSSNTRSQFNEFKYCSEARAATATKTKLFIFLVARSVQRILYREIYTSLSLETPPVLDMRPSTRPGAIDFKNSA